jgi:hypothetical protein
MGWKEKLDFIKNLGWVETGEWANRTFYGFPCGKKTFGQLVENNNDWSISKGDDSYYIENPTDEEIEKYTELVKNYIGVVTGAETHTVKELMDAVKALKEFYNERDTEEEGFSL